MTIDTPKLNIDQIKKLLPHRHPILLIDEVISYEPYGSITALKNLTEVDPCFAGHFPGEPIMPGVLIIEALAQAAALLGIISIENPPPNALYYLVGIDNARFKQPVVPGDQLILTAEFEKVRRNIWKFNTEAKVEDKIVASADILTTVKGPAP